jgi:hypothetical protein
MDNLKPNILGRGITYDVCSKIYKEDSPDVIFITPITNNNTYLPLIDNNVALPSVNTFVPVVNTKNNCYNLPQTTEIEHFGKKSNSMGSTSIEHFGKKSNSMGSTPIEHFGKKSNSMGSTPIKSYVKKTNLGVLIN